MSTCPEGHRRLAERDFIDDLVNDLAPVRPGASWFRAALVWIALSTIFVSVAIVVTGPVRAALEESIFSTPRLALELFIGILAIGVTGAVGLEVGVPGTPRRRALLSLPTLLMLAWLGWVLWAAAHSNGEPAMIGKRAHCFLESLVFSLPPFCLALHLLRGRIAFSYGASGLLMGSAGAAIPALWMEFACMADPGHALRFHLTAVATLAAFGALVARRVLSGP